MSSDTANAPQTGILKRIESLLAIALTRAAAGITALLPLRNQVNTNGALSDLSAPSAVLIAAIKATPRASGVFLVTVNYIGADSAADTVTIEVSTAEAVTAFSGGTVEQTGSGSPISPEVRYAAGSSITATAGTPVEVAQASDRPGGAGGTSVSMTARCPLTPGEAGLILIRLTAAHNLDTQTLDLAAFELPSSS